MAISLCSTRFLLLSCYVSLSLLVPVVSGQCDGNQQQSLLLQLKNSLITNDSTESTKLVMWSTASDYCSWEGVFCKQGCVTQLDLSYEYMYIPSVLDNSSALFSLKYIEHLNLAFNNFSYGQIPSEFNKLTNLRYLNLSNAGFTGQIPIEISQLTRLEILDLSTISFPGVAALQLENPNLNQLIGNLSEIVELHLDGVYISAPGAQWCQAISSSLPKLRVLSLSNCNLLGPIDDSLLNLTSLSQVRIDSNNLDGSIPESMCNSPYLQVLDLSNNSLSGFIPQCLSATAKTLVVLNLRRNKLVGSIPDTFSVNCTLKTLDLNGNQLGTQFPGSLANCRSLEVLNLGNDLLEDAAPAFMLLTRTNISGSLPESIGKLKMLSRVDFSYCNFTGSIPKSMASLAELVYVDMSGNKLSGSVPDLSMAKNLTDLNLSYNKLTGQINSTFLEGLKSLVNLNLGNNNLSGSIPSSLFSLPLLQRLDLSNNQFSGQLHDISDVNKLENLDLSSNYLEGPLSQTIFNLRRIQILALSSNNFSGSFPLNSIQQLKNLSSLDLSYNSLSISYNSSSNSTHSSFPNITRLNLASGKLRTFPDFLMTRSKLADLDLSQNQIDGEIPNWIWSLSNLVILNLSCNSLQTFEGPFSNITSALSVLDLHSNQLQGPIPIIPTHAFYLDYSRNNFSSSIPEQIGYFLFFTFFFSLSSNNFDGIIPESICSARILEVLDFSNNSLSGNIPECLPAMVTSSRLGVLNLRGNNLNGSISDNFLRNCMLQALDLSGNQLHGKFPKSLSQCTELKILDLGNNQMTDTFPFMLGNIASLRVLILRSNNFFGSFDCQNTSGNWPMLQIIDLANNSFSGDIPANCLRKWPAMMVDEDASPSVLNHPEFKIFLFSKLPYVESITIMSKGLEMELLKILNIYTSVDLSSNKFSGSIPEELGGLTSLFILNLSSNSLTGEIPPSLGNLKQLESLDLSKNNISGRIPKELVKLNFLSFMNLSYNQLVGHIPTGTQFSTFQASSFEGNIGLWGPPLTAEKTPPPPPNNESHSPSRQDRIDWDFLSVEMGFVSGFGIAIGSLLFCKKWRRRYYRAMYSILVKIFPQLEERLGKHRRHVHIIQMQRR